MCQQLADGWIKLFVIAQSKEFEGFLIILLGTKQAVFEEAHLSLQHIVFILATIKR